ncbi:hypothetical protein CSUI_006223, partial [Cystoisospora suis]
REALFFVPPPHHRNAAHPTAHPPFWRSIRAGRLRVKRSAGEAGGNPSASLFAHVFPGVSFFCPTAAALFRACRVCAGGIVE